MNNTPPVIPGRHYRATYNKFAYSKSRLAHCSPHEFHLRAQIIVEFVSEHYHTLSALEPHWVTALLSDHRSLAVFTQFMPNHYYILQDIFSNVLHVATLLKTLQSVILSPVEDQTLTAQGLLSSLLSLGILSISELYSAICYIVHPDNTQNISGPQQTQPTLPQPQPDDIQLALASCPLSYGIDTSQMDPKVIRANPKRVFWSTLNHPAFDKITDEVALDICARTRLGNYTKRNEFEMVGQDEIKVKVLHDGDIDEKYDWFRYYLSLFSPITMDQFYKVKNSVINWVIADNEKNSSTSNQLLFNKSTTLEKELIVSDQHTATKHHLCEINPPRDRVQFNYQTIMKNQLIYTYAEYKAYKSRTTMEDSSPNPSTLNVQLPYQPTPHPILKTTPGQLPTESVVNTNEYKLFFITTFLLGGIFDLNPVTFAIDVISTGYLTGYDLHNFLSNLSSPPNFNSPQLPSNLRQIGFFQHMNAISRLYKLLIKIAPSPSLEFYLQTILYRAYLEHNEVIHMANLFRAQMSTNGGDDDDDDDQMSRSPSPPPPALRTQHPGAPPAPPNVRFDLPPPPALNFGENRQLEALLRELDGDPLEDHEVEALVREFEGVPLQQPIDDLADFIRQFAQIENEAMGEGEGEDEDEDGEDIFEAAFDHAQPPPIANQPQPQTTPGLNEMLERDDSIFPPVPFTIPALYFSQYSINIREFEQLNTFYFHPFSIHTIASAAARTIPALLELSPARPCRSSAEPLPISQLFTIFSSIAQQGALHILTHLAKTSQWNFLDALMLALIHFHPAHPCIHRVNHNPNNLTAHPDLVFQYANVDYAWAGLASPEIQTWLTHYFVNRSYDILLQQANRTQQGQSTTRDLTFHQHLFSSLLSNIHDTTCHCAPIFLLHSPILFPPYNTTVIQKHIILSTNAAFLNPTMPTFPSSSRNAAVHIHSSPLTTLPSLPTSRTIYLSSLFPNSTRANSPHSTSINLAENIQHLQRVLVPFRTLIYSYLVLKSGLSRFIQAPQDFAALAYYILRARQYRCATDQPIFDQRQINPQARRTPTDSFSPHLLLPYDMFLAKIALIEQDFVVDAIEVDASGTIIDVTPATAPVSRSTQSQPIAKQFIIKKQQLATPFTDDVSHSSLVTTGDRVIFDVSLPQRIQQDNQYPPNSSVLSRINSIPRPTFIHLQKLYSDYLRRSYTAEQAIVVHVLKNVLHKYSTSITQLFTAHQPLTNLLVCLQTSTYPFPSPISEAQIKVENAKFTTLHHRNNIFKPDSAKADSKSADVHLISIKHQFAMWCLEMLVCMIFGVQQSRQLLITGCPLCDTQKQCEFCSTLQSQLSNPSTQRTAAVLQHPSRFFAPNLTTIHPCSLDFWGQYMANHQLPANPRARGLRTSASLCFAFDSLLDQTVPNTLLFQSLLSNLASETK